MERVTAWFERQAARERGIVYLEDGLLGGRFGPYFAYRLRFFILRWAVASVLQLVKVLLLRELFAPGEFLSVVSAVAAAGLVSGAWWGALECLRAEVRRSYRVSSRDWTSRLIAGWVSASIRAALLLAGAVAVGFALMAAWGAGPDAASLAVGAIVIRVAFELPVRAYHAGVYALRRVYRPFLAILVLETLSVGALVVLARPLGAYAVAASELVVAVAFSLVAVHYTARAGRTLGLRPGSHVAIRPRWSRRGRLGHAARQAVRSVPGVIRLGAAPAAAGGLMALDSLVILALAGAAVVQPAGTWAALLVAAISPTIRAGFDWAKLTYFDFKRLDAAWLGVQRRQFDRASVLVALVIAACLWVYAVIVASLVLGLATPSRAGLACLLVGGSLLGLAQMEAFTREAYRRVAIGGAGLTIALAGAGPAAVRGADPLAFLGLVALAAAVATRVAGRWLPRGRGGPADALLPTEWLTALRSTTGPVTVGVLRIPAAGWGRRPSRPEERSDAWRARRLARRLAEIAGPDGAVTSLPPDRVMWFAPVRDVESRRRRHVLDAGQALRAAGGRVRHLRTGGPYPDGPTALLEVGAWGALESARTAPPRPDWPPLDPTRLVERFHALLPAGEVLRPGARNPDMAAPAGHGRRRAAWLTGRSRRSVLFAAAAYARDLEPDPRALPLEVTAWCPAGRLEILFVADAGAPRKARRRWRAELRAANLEMAAGGRLTRGAILDPSARDRAPVALAASAAMHFRREQ